MANENEKKYASLESLRSFKENADKLYATQTEVDELSADVAKKANSSHTHDDRYYTESESDNKYLHKVGGEVGSLTFSSGGKGITFTCKDSTKYFIYGDGSTTSLYTMITDTNGTNNWYQFMDDSGNLYSNKEIVATLSDIPDYITTGAKSGTTLGFHATAEGGNTTASGDYSHAEGNNTTASGDCSHAEGGSTTASGYYSHAEGHNTTASGHYSHASGYGTLADSYQYVAGKYNEQKPAPAAADTQDSTGSDAIFVVGYGTSTTRANAFRITSGGKCRGVSTFTASGADFAELFEWKDGNPDNEDRRGLFVALDGEKIRLANADDDYIGVISGAQSFVGNTASEEWQGKYVTDVFGARLSQKIEIPEKIDEATGNVIPAHTTTQFIVNPDYNPDEEYIMRENRKEWGTVGLLGQVVVIDDGTCTVGGYTKPLANGIGTASDTGYRVMKRIDENHIKVLVK